MNKPNAGTTAPKEAAGVSEVVVRLGVSVRLAHLRRPRHPIGCPCGEARSIEAVWPNSWPLARACEPRSRACSRAYSGGRPSVRTTRAVPRARCAPARPHRNPLLKGDRTCSRLHRRTPHRATAMWRRPLPGEGFSWGAKPKSTAPMSARNKSRREEHEQGGETGGA